MVMIVESFPVEDDEVMGEVEEQTEQQNEKPTFLKTKTYYKRPCEFEKEFLDQK